MTYRELRWYNVENLTERKICMTKKKNNLIKKITSLILILSLLFAFSSFTASANNDIKVLLDGKPITFDVPPQIINGRTLVPMRAIFEALGAQVEWDENSKTIGAFKDSTIIIMTINQGTYLKNEDLLVFDVAPQIVNGRTLVPVRAIAECFDCDVTWDNASRTVFINSSNNSKNNSVLKFYNNTTIPTYESATNSNLLRKIDSSEEIRGLTKDIYVYNYNLDDEKQYVNVLTKYGFQEIQNFDEFRVFANPSTGERVLLQGANGGDGSSTIWIRIGLGTSASATTDSSYDVYDGTNLPTYTSVTGVNLKKIITSEGFPIYVYAFTNEDDVSLYLHKLSSSGWKLLHEDDKSTSDKYEIDLYKGNNIALIRIYFRLNEVWITY